MPFTCVLYCIITLIQVVPKYNNLHDIAVGENASVTVTLFNYCSCYFTSRLYHEIYGMGDDHSGDRFKIDSYVVSSNYDTIMN